MGKMPKNASANGNLERCKLCPAISKIIGTRLLCFFIKVLIFMHGGETNHFMRIASPISPEIICAELKLTCVSFFRLPTVYWGWGGVEMIYFIHL